MTSSVTSTSTGSQMGFTTVFTILMENHDYAEIVGSPNAPYINSLIAQGGLATNYFDSGTHPSLPNYLYLISGQTLDPYPFDVDPGTFPFPDSSDNLGNQMNTGGIKWRSYAETAGSACNLSSSGNYGAKHVPFLYFSDIQSNASLCSGTNVDYSSFAADLAAGTYKYMWITPNLVDDGHNPVNALGTATDPVGSLTTSDTWLSTEVPKILASATYQAGGVIFITWDEAEGRNGDNGDQVPMIILSPKIKSAGFTSATHYTHANYLATIEDLYGFPHLGAAVGKTNMMEFFQ